jgi:hypothetical protein
LESGANRRADHALEAAQKNDVRTGELRSAPVAGTPRGLRERLKGEV